MSERERARYRVHMALRYAPPAHDDELCTYLAIGFQSLVGTPLPTEPGFRADSGVGAHCARSRHHKPIVVVYPATEPEIFPSPSRK